MKHKLLSFFVGSMILTSVAFAQEKKVSGRVTGADGKPLAGVTIAVQGSNVATQTDANGNYSLSVPTGKVIVFRSVGFADKTLIVKEGQSAFNVSLDNSNRDLEEVIVTALGVKREKRDLGYAADQVSSKTVTQASAVNTINGLQGKVSGLNVTTTNSGVFEDVKINLRGIRSLTGKNEPLLVLDGVQMDIKYLSSINPNDIDNVSVLKGAASAAIYGPDARNGVIMVTTKKGSDAPSINLSHSTQWQNISFFPKMQKRFGQGYTDGTERVYDPIENWNWGPAFDGSMVEVGPVLPDGSQQKIAYSARDDREKFYDTGVTNQTNLSLTSKDFFLSLEDSQIKGIVPGDKNRRTGVRLNSQKEYGIFRAGLNFNYAQQNYDVYNQRGQADYYSAKNTGGNSGLFSQLLNTAANIPLLQYKDYLNGQFATYDTWFTDYGLNPYFSLGNWRKNGKKQDLLTNLELGLKPTDWLSFTYRASLNSRNIAERTLTQGVTPSAFGLKRNKSLIPAAVKEYNYNQTILSSDFFANVDFNIDEDFKFNGILGTYVRQNDYRATDVGASNLVISDLYNLENRVGNLTGSSDGFRSRLFSTYASAGLNYKNWANVEVTGRWDKTSLLSMANNSYFYPGVNAAVVLSDAIPEIKSEVFNYLKLRGAWTKTANADITPYLLAAVFSQKAETGFPFGSVSGVTAGNTTYDPNLKPERINTSEAGFEAGLWNNRVTVQATYFYSKNTDQIANISISEASGYSRSYRNAASFNSKGVEFDINLSPLIKFNNGSVKFKANALWNDSEVTSIYKQQELNQLQIGGYNAASNYAIVGLAAYQMRATDYVRDDQGRIIVNATTGRPSTSSQNVNFGRTLPKWILGLNPSVNWKNFNLSALFEHKGGHVVSFFGLGSDMAWTGVSEATIYNDRNPFILPNSVIADPNNPGKYIENTTAKIGEGKNNPIEAYYTGEFKNTASNFIVSANQWRLRELSLTYDVPSTWLVARQKVIKGLSIALVGRNLALWLPKANKFMDPEFDSMPDYQNAYGNINSDANPPVRNFGFTVNAKF
ncbi:SusC/RagA family TonB-linked outer membrane protein [Sphingobacterium sp. WOUb80]|uniref:SusC/RagA family TonB-linked outer membrane protein n=1 Tax=Sphingobacterium sp. WOUb80 TaxID=3234028 RepID=UPI003CF466C1